jgi:hypothetical protein
VFFGSQPLEIARSKRQVIGLSWENACYQKHRLWDQFPSYCREMDDKSQRAAGLFIAPSHYADWAVVVFGWLRAWHAERHFLDWAFRRRCWRVVVCLGLV